MRPKNKNPLEMSQTRPTYCKNNAEESAFHVNKSNYRRGAVLRPDLPRGLGDSIVFRRSKRGPRGSGVDKREQSGDSEEIPFMQLTSG